MRYEKLVYFVRSGQDIYDPKTGDYISSEPEKIEMPAAVSSISASSAGSEKIANILWGKMHVSAKSVLTLHHVDFAFDFIEIDGRRYEVQATERYRTKDLFYVTEAPQ